MKTIGLLASHKQAFEGINKYLTEQGYAVVDMTSSVTGIDKWEAVIILEPFQLKGEYYSLFPTWKKYLSIHAQNVKLLIAGFKPDVEHNNYISLLDHWKSWDIAKSIANAYGCAEYWGDTAVFENGRSIIDRVRLFFIGHNQYSIIDCITKVRAMLDSAKINYYGNHQLKKEKSSFRKVWDEVIYPGQEDARLLISRWKFYNPYFHYLPFINELKRIGAGAYMTDLQQLIHGRKGIKQSPEEMRKREEHYAQSDFFSRLTKITQSLRRINQVYINPEPQAKILMVDDDASWHQQMIKSFPEFSFFSVHSPENLNESIKSFKPNLILLDLDLGPDEKHHLQGVDILTKLSTEQQEIPVIIVSSHQKRRIVEKTWKAGAAYYLAKPNFDINKWSKVFGDVSKGKKFEIDDIPVYHDQTIPSIKPKVLVIEDDTEWYNSSILNLTTNKYTFIRAVDIAEGRDLINKMGPDFHLVILELYFEDEEGNDKERGLAFIDWIKQELGYTPIIVMTKSNSDNIELQALNKDIEYYLNKAQYNSRLWLLTIKNAIDRKELLDQTQALQNNA